MGVQVGINKLGNCFSVFAKAEDIPSDPKVLRLGIPLPKFNSYFTKPFLPKLSNCHRSKTVQDSPTLEGIYKIVRYWHNRKLYTLLEERNMRIKGIYIMGLYCY